MFEAFGPCLDFSLIPCVEKKSCFSFGGRDKICSNQDRVGLSSNQGLPQLDHGSRKAPAYNLYEN